MKNDERVPEPETHRAEVDAHPSEPPEEAGAPAVLPDPSGTPVPVSQSEPGCSLTGTVLGLLAAGGLLVLALPVLLSRPTLGATRSAELKWQEREMEIEQAIAEEQAYRAAGESQTEFERDRANE